MQHLFHFLFVAFFAATSLLLTACGGDKKKDPAPTTGMVNGQISPANAVTTVTATSGGTPATTATATPNASGVYAFAALAPGTYTLSYTPAAGFATPAPQTVTVAAGETVTAAPVTVTASVPGGSGSGFAYTVGGAPATATLVSANVLAGSLVLQGSSSSRTVSISLDQVPTGPRTYSFGGVGSTSEITVMEAVGSNFAEWNTTLAAGSGYVTITAVSANPRRVWGTFTAVAQPRGTGTTGTRTLTSGTFSNLSF
ncbi:carboxypeptidase-like regulatory domain-containing protein [Hymenobacter antarcticus]|uniref:Carboxypeptidase regulatory-like domain-containing protein n=1 Tax=Hymenobacter antarcticus TaxID=486270 RepID=A0ABP7PWA9_9BACT